MKLLQAEKIIFATIYKEKQESIPVITVLTISDLHHSGASYLTPRQSEIYSVCQSLTAAFFFIKDFNLRLCDSILFSSALYFLSSQEIRLYESSYLGIRHQNILVFLLYITTFVICLVMRLFL